jgi:DNA-binding NtrC family response regulator
MKSRVLIVDDYPEMRSLISLLITSQFRCEVDEASSGIKAAEFLSQKNFALVISDFEMDCGSGLWLYQYMKNNDPGLPLVIISSVFDKVNLSLDETLRAILSKDRIVQLPRILKDLKLEHLTAL